MPHLNAIKARVKKIADYHRAKLGLTTEIYVVERFPAGDGKGAIGLAYTHAHFFKESGKWKHYRPHIRLLRSAIEKHWDNPGYLDDLIVHELMHFKAGITYKNGRCVAHNAGFRQALKDYGYHPDQFGWNPARKVPALD